MPTTIRPSDVQQEAIQLRSYQLQNQMRHDADMRELEKKHGEDVTQMLERQTKAKEALEKDFEVQFSDESERLESQLQALRHQGEMKIATEKQLQEKELTKTKRVYQAQIDEYRKNSEAQLESLRKQLQASTEMLQEKARKQEAKTAQKG
jgi:hypothetical protein